MTKQNDFWPQIKARVEAVATLDPKCNQIFGAADHRYQFNAPVEMQRVRAFEEKNGVKLPEDFVSFLQVCGDGGAGPSYGIYPFETMESTDVSSPWHLSETQEWPDEYDDNPMWNFNGLLTIGTRGCCIDYYLEVNGSSPGIVWIDEGPEDTFRRLETFADWYESWLEEVEFGLKLHWEIKAKIDAGCSFSELTETIDNTWLMTKRYGDFKLTVPWLNKWFTFNTDGVDYLRFHGVPSAFAFDGGKMLKKTQTISEDP